MLIQDIAGRVLSHKSEIDAHLVQSLYKTAIGNLRFKNVLQRQFLVVLPPLEVPRLLSKLNFETKSSASLRYVLIVLLKNLLVLVVCPDPSSVLAPPLDPSVAVRCAPVLQEAHFA